VVLPSLLPFFILSELMLSFGIVHFLGVLFEPLMRPLFNVPGVGSFVLSMGVAAGYPLDAVITAKVRKDGLCSQVEGERMLAFSNTADPLFMFGAVAVGMFGIPALGVVLAIAHYVGALLVGLAFRSWRANGPQSDSPQVKISGMGMWREAAKALYQARLKDGRPLGTVLSDAIRDAIATLFMIMSFIVLLSVVIQVLTTIGVIPLLGRAFGSVFGLVGVNPALFPPLVKGVFELDIGAAAAAASHATLVDRAAVASAIIAWSGLSVHAQVASVLTGSDISMRPYFLARALHAILAALLTVLLLGPVGMGAHLSAPAFAAQGAGGASFLPRLGLSAAWAVVAGGALLLAGLAVGLARQSRLVAAWPRR